MRTIKFRGKDAKSGEWLYGSLIQYKSGETAIAKFSRYGYECSDMNRTRVDPATVGQFTGLHDKNGLEIYEGDIVRHDENSEYFEVEYDAPEFRYKENTFGFRFMVYTPELITVVGNIHDNPELMKGGQK